MRHFVHLLLTLALTFTLIASSYGSNTPGPCPSPLPACTTPCGAGCTWTMSIVNNVPTITASDGTNTVTINSSSQTACVQPNTQVTFTAAPGVGFNLFFGNNSLFGKKNISTPQPATSADAACSDFNLTMGGYTLDPKVIVNGTQIQGGTQQKTHKTRKKPEQQQQQQ